MHLGAQIERDRRGAELERHVEAAAPERAEEAVREVLGAGEELTLSTPSIDDSVKK